MIFLGSVRALLAFLRCLEGMEFDGKGLGRQRKDFKSRRESSVHQYMYTLGESVLTPITAYMILGKVRM